MPLLSLDARTTVRSIVKVLLKFLFAVAFLWAVFYFFCDFTNTQSWVLALFIAGAADVAVSRSATQENSFSPYRLLFRIRLFAMLSDVGLVHSIEEYDALREKTPATIGSTWSDDHLFREGAVVAYVIGTNPDLVHLPFMFRYQEFIDIEMRLNPLASEEPWGATAPEIFIRKSFGGYAIGVRVKDDWWAENEARVKQGIVLRQDKEWNFGTVRLTLAELPGVVFRDFYAPADYNHKRRLEREQAEIDTLTNASWKKEDLGGPEIGYFGESFDHRYAQIWVQPL